MVKSGEICLVTGSTTGKRATVLNERNKMLKPGRRCDLWNYMMDKMIKEGKKKEAWRRWLDPAESKQQERR